MLIIKELKLPHPVLTKGLLFGTMLVAFLYQAIAFYDYSLIEKLCLEAVYLAQLTKLRAIQEHLPSTYKYGI